MKVHEVEKQEAWVWLEIISHQRLRMKTALVTTLGHEIQRLHSSVEHILFIPTEAFNMSHLIKFICSGLRGCLPLMNWSLLFVLRTVWFTEIVCLGFRSHSYSSVYCSLFFGKKNRSFIRLTEYIVDLWFPFPSLPLEWTCWRGKASFTGAATICSIANGLPNTDWRISRPVGCIREQFKRNQAGRWSHATNLYPASK